ncbi:MAG: hypothetical protein CL676_04005 [Bdellovibrionaceae bacterium]|nr:hypothetical protein [Pseudobdellovibrionaceae bacterium]
MTRADGFITLVEGLLGYKQFNLVKRACEEAISTRKFHNDPRTWKLLAVANGSLGNHELAKSALREALVLRYDENTLANLVTACFATDATNEALSLVEDHWEFMDERAKSDISRSLNEAIRIGKIDGRDIPNNVLNEYIEFTCENF